MSRTVAILGSTGSIGANAVWVAQALGEAVRIHGLAAGRNWQRLAEQARELGVGNVSIADPALLAPLRAALPPTCKASADPDALIRMVTDPAVDVVLCAIAGTAGFAPVLAAIRAGKTIALASKEILVMAGELVMHEAKRAGAPILPVDSEHSAIFQCLQGHPPEAVDRLVLTASGGPFRSWSEAAIDAATYDDALAHPTWAMGPKVTIDSATMMNKALELIEAHWLFDVPPERIDVVVHPQSIVHSMVEFVDGSILAQLSNPDMRLPIQFALTYPRRVDSGLPRTDLTAIGQLTFERPRNALFPAIDLARRALVAGGTMSTVLNAANEVAVARFQQSDISFPAISRLVEAVMADHKPLSQGDLVSIQEADRWARVQARKWVTVHGVQSGL